MGSISKHPLAQFIRNYNTKCFIETGTWKGTGINYATKHDFNQIMSIDISPKHLKENTKRFQSDKRVQLFIGDSGVELEKMLAKVDKSSNVLFWLDAHLPDLNGDEQKLSMDIIIPLHRELKLIKSIRDISGDVFIIDDLRLFEYVDVPMFENCFTKDTDRTTDFIIDELSSTHNITKDYRDQGYLIALPN